LQSINLAPGGANLAAISCGSPLPFMDRGGPRRRAEAVGAAMLPGEVASRDAGQSIATSSMKSKPNGRRVGRRAAMPAGARIEISRRLWQARTRGGRAGAVCRDPAVPPVCCHAYNCCPGARRHAGLYLTQGIAARHAGRALRPPRVNRWSGPRSATSVPSSRTRLRERIPRMVMTAGR